jgi:hypothetical protein
MTNNLKKTSLHIVFGMKYIGYVLQVIGKHFF